MEGARIALQHNLGLGGACVVTLYQATASEGQVEGACMIDHRPIGTALRLPPLTRHTLPCTKPGRTPCLAVVTRRATAKW